MSVLDRYRDWIGTLGVPMEALETDVHTGVELTERFNVDMDDEDSDVARSTRAQREALQMLLGQSPTVLSLRETFNMLYYALRKARLQNDADSAEGVNAVIFHAYAQVFPLILARLTPRERETLETEAKRANVETEVYIAQYLDRVMTEDWEKN